MGEATDISGTKAAGGPRRHWLDLGGAWIVFKWLVIMATAWYLLKELAPLLRPLLLAMLLAYIVLPVHLYVRGQVRAGARHLALLIGLIVIASILAIMAYGNVVDLSRELPRLNARAHEIVTQANSYAGKNLPWLKDAISGTLAAEDQGAGRIQEVMAGLVNVTAGALFEAVAVIFFLILILLEGRRFPMRVRTAFSNEQTEYILATVGSINEAIASYLKVKVKASLALALPAALILWVLGVKYVLLWGVLTFLANFIPYLGSIVSCSLPILFAFLDLDSGWKPIVVAVLLPAVHALSAYLIEPAMTGKAVNLSPLVVLISLSFWGLCWGLTGMILAVPLTAMLKIVLESAPSTRPIGWLMGED